MSQIIFLSDFHLGAPDGRASLEREMRICNFLDSIKKGTSEIFFVGDIFDFWFEYATTVPKGFYRILGKFAELSDSGIRLHFFKGNHDMWMCDLFQKEFGAEIYSHALYIERFGKKILVGHGDGLGPKDYKYKFLKLFFASSWCRFLFKWVHPDIGICVARYFSHQSRFGRPCVADTYRGDREEWLYVYCKEYLKSGDVDYFIFGHRHLPIYTPVGDTHTIYVNLGDWLDHNTYAILNANGLSLLQYETSRSDSDFDPRRMG